MPAPLDGIKVLDFTRFQAGPTATVLLSDLGADIVKVEIPGQGDQGRYIHAVEGLSATPYFIAHDRGKRGITVDFRSPQGKEILLKIGAGCDVIVENFRPGYADKIGLGYEAFRARNEVIVYAAVSAYGEDGPLGNLTGFDIHGQAMGGIMSVAGDDGASYTAGAAIGDQLAGMTLASAVLGGLVARERQGHGQKVTVSLYGCQLALQSWEINQYALGGSLPPKAKTGHPQLHKTGMIWGSFPTKEGDVVLGGVGGARWQIFCELLGIDPGPDVDPRASFIRDKSAFLPAIRKGLLKRTADEWVRLFRDQDLMISKVNTYADVVDDPQAWANGYMIELEDPNGRKLPVVGSPFRFYANPVKPQGPPPELGQHTEEVLIECGFGWEEIASWRDQGII